MTTAALTLRPLPRGARPGLGRLTAVELRKMVDTRAGFWLLVSVAALTAVAMTLLAIFGKDGDHDFKTYLSLAVQPASVLLPVVGILLVTSEWSQRTGQITFTLVPQRTRVLIAKALAGLVLGVVALVLAVGVAAIGVLVAGSSSDPWHLPAGILGQDAVFLLTGMLTGIAFGAAFLSSAPAIVLSFVLPIGFSALSLIPGFDSVAEWLDASQSIGPMTDRLYDATDWAQVATTLALWMALPLAIGTWRILTREVR